MSFLPMLLKENLEMRRSKKLLVLLIIFAFVAISSPILAKILPDLLKNVNTAGITINIPTPTWRDAIDQLVKNLAQFGLIVIIFMFAGSIAEEKNKKTFEILLTKPISRAGVILAKFCSGLLYITGVFLLFQIIFYYYTVSLFGSLDLANFAWLTLFLLVYLLTIFALTIFFSTISKSLVMAALLTFAVGIVSTMAIGYIKVLKNYSPSYIIGSYKDLMDTGNYHVVLPSFYTSLVVIIVLVFLSIFFFFRQEVER